MVELNKYELYNQCIASVIDPAIELVNIFNQVDYDKTLAYIVEHFGELTEKSKTVDLPKVSKKLKIDYNKNKTEINIEVYKDDCIEGMYMISKSPANLKDEFDEE